ncbi:MAG: hypothetical protein OJF49_001618 [Ktedonobacterales bacterium]|nr:MAG: hypothetical protein OJF49_001618 [Ktedonobacterales bacterium]
MAFATIDGQASCSCAFPRPRNPSLVLSHVRFLAPVTYARDGAAQGRYGFLLKHLR